MTPRDRAAALFRRVSAGRLGLVAAGVTLAFSQIVLQLISENKLEFPERASFHAGVLLWAWILPVLAVLAIDLLLVPGDEPAGGPGLAWRAALYAVTALSFALQAQVHYFPRATEDLGDAGRWALLASLGLLLWAVLVRTRAPLHRYFGVLGILALLLVGRFVASVGLWGPAWMVSSDPGTRRPADDPGLPPVFVLVFDELSFEILAGPDGRPDRALYPHLAALADDSRWFVNATTNAGFTHASVEILQTGRYRKEGSSEADPLLFDLLPSGYLAEASAAWLPVARWIRRRQRSNPRFASRAIAFDPGFFELPGLIRSGLARSPLFTGVRKGVFDEPDHWMIRHAEDRLSTELRDLLHAVPDARGRFLYWHTSLPHFPFDLDETGRPHGDPSVSFVSKPSRPFDAVLANYGRQVKSVDVIVRRFVEALKAAGLYETSILLLTSDHGLRTWDRGPQKGIMDQLARVPLLIKAPGLTPGVSDVDYQHIDFVPTVLDLLGAPVPAGLSGVSALASRRPERRKWLDWAGYVYWRDARTGRWAAEDP